MTLVDLTFLQFQLIALLDADRHRDVTFDEVYAAIDNADVLGWLKIRFAGHVDLSLYGTSRAGEVEAALEAASGGLRGRERRKTGVETNGLCLLLAFTTEAIQQGQWEHR